MHLPLKSLFLGWCFFCVGEVFSKLAKECLCMFKKP
jgi:hypothetical protein